MTGATLLVEIVAANPGPAVHVAALGILILVGLAVVGVMRRRHRREAAKAERQPNPDDRS
jgi:hypothetical protein